MYAAGDGDMMHLKSRREIDRLRASADLVGRVLAEVARHVEPGVSTRELDRIAEDYIRRSDAEPAFKGYQVGSSSPYPGTLCVSVNDVIVHGIPGGYRLKAGDLIAIDCGVKLGGYYGDSAYTFAVGDISAEQTRLCQVTYEALYKGIAQAIHGQQVGDISHAVQSHCEAHGFGVVRDLVGHGIGRELHEDPQVPNVGRPRTGRRLRTGATLCIEPMINMGTFEVTVSKDGWTVRTADGAPSAHYEHMVAVGPEEPEILTTFQYIEDVTHPPYLQEAPTYG